MTRLLLAALAVVCLLVPAYGQQTTVADHLQLAASAPNAAPTPVIGKLQITYPAFTDVNGQFYAAASQVVTINPDGSFSTSLPASDTSIKQGDASPGGLYYTITYYASGSGVAVNTDTWFVRASATPLTISQVTTHSSNPPLQFDSKGAAAAAQAASLQKAANLSDLASIQTAKQNLQLSTVATSGRFEDLTDAPLLSTVASSGRYADLSGLPVIPSKTSQLTNDSNFLSNLTVAPVAISGKYADLTGLPYLSTVAGTGSYNDLLNKPALTFDASGAAAQVFASSLQKSANLSDITNASAARTALGLSTEAASGQWADILGKPAFAPIATSGLYADLSGTPAIPTKLSQLTNDTNFLVSGTLATVATTGSYNDLANKPALNFDVAGAASAAETASLSKALNLSDVPDKTAAKANLSLAPVASSGAYADLSGVPALSTVATSGSYVDLTHQPTIPSKTSQLTNDSSFVATSQLSTVATTGAYADVTGKPVLAPVATSGLYSSLAGLPTLSTVAGTGKYSDLIGAPALSIEATSGSYLDLTNKPTLSLVAGTGLYTDLIGAPVVPTKTSQLTNDAGFVPAASLSTVATTGSYSDLKNPPALNFDVMGAAAAAQAADLSKTANLSDLTDVTAAKTHLGLSPVASSGLYADLTGAPALATVATSGSYVDLTHQPTIPTKTSQLTNDSSFVATTQLSTVATTGAYTDLTGKPVLAPVATSGLYSALSGLPTLSTVSSTGRYSDLLGAPVLSQVATSGAFADLAGKPTLSLVSSTGLYTDLIGAPVVPTKTSQLTNDANFVAASTLATVATTGSYADLKNQPALNFDPLGSATAAAASSLQKSANLTDLASASAARTALGLSLIAASGSYTDLVNKPAFSAVALSGNYGDLLNQPVIPSKTSQLTNDAGFAVASALAPVASTGAYADLTGKPVLPTKVSDLTNDAGYVNATTAPVRSVNGLTGAVALSFLTPGNNLSDLTNVTTAQHNLNLAAVASSGSYADLLNAPVLGTAATHPLADFVLTSQINQQNGVPGLDASAQINPAQIPDLPLNKITGIGTAAGHAEGDFLFTSALGVTVAPLNGSKQVPLANMSPVPYNSLVGAPTLATVATSGSYVDLLNKPAGLPPTGPCGGDLGGTYPNCTVTGVNNTNIANLGVGLLKTTTGGILALAANSDITTALTFVPLNPANNLSELTNQPLAQHNLGLGNIATLSAASFLADNGTNGIPFRTAPGTTRVATPVDLVNLFGYQPLNPDQLGVTIATLDGTTHKLTGTQLPPVDWSNITNAPNFVLTSAVGVSVAPLVGGLVPTANLPSPQVATATSQGVANFPTAGALVVSSGAVSVDRSQFDAAGVATAAQAASLQKSANLSDLANAATARQNLQLAPVASSGSYNDLTSKPTLSAVASSGSYNDLLNLPTIPTKTSQLTNDSSFVASTALSTVATTGQFLDLKNIPLIPTKTSQLANDANFVPASALSTVATTGQYADLHGTPALATVATTGSYTDLVNIPAAPVVSTVGHTGQYSDLLNAPVLGSASTHSYTDFVSSSAVGSANGVAPLDQVGHVPFLNLAVGIPGGLATLDGNSRLSQSQIPTSGIAATAIGSGTVSNAAYGYLANVTSDIQTQLNGVIKMASGSTAGLTYYDGSTNQLQSINSASNRSAIIPATLIADGSISNAEFETLDGASSNLQTQINGIVTALGGYQQVGDTSLSSFKTALAASTSNVTHIILWADSLTKCAQDGPCGYGAQNFSSLWPNQLASWLQGQGYTIAGTGIIPIEASNGSGSPGTADSRWQYSTPVVVTANADGSTHSPSTTFTTQGQTHPINHQIGPWQTAYGADSGVYYAPASGDSGQAAFVLSPQTGDTVTIYCATNTDTVSGGGLSIAIDNVYMGEACDQTTSGFQAHAVNFSAPTGLGSHTLVVAFPTPGGGYGVGYLYGASWQSASHGVIIDNVARGGALADWFGTNTSTQEAFTDLLPNISLYVIGLGTNDYYHTNLSSYEANMNNLMSKAGSTNVMILDMLPSSGGSGSSAAFKSFEQSLTANHRAAWVTTDGSSTNRPDGTHFDNASQGVVAGLVESAITNASSGGGTIIVGGGSSTPITAYTMSSSTATFDITNNNNPGSNYSMLRLFSNGNNAIAIQRSSESVTAKVGFVSNASGDVPWQIGQLETGDNAFGVGYINSSGVNVPMMSFGAANQPGSMPIDNISTKDLMPINDSTGGGSASLGSNSPASSPGQPYTWIEFLAVDGTKVYVPAWK